ncbi:MAG: AI-2E family transporter, partial [Armatimonadetes bacterium]|nr:AI-2E family transporter [Armatimonadota bacterium]
TLDAVMAIAAPFVGAIVLSLMLEPVVRMVQNRLTRGNRAFSLAIVFLLLLGVVGGALAYAGPALVKQGQRLIRFFTPVTYTVERSVGKGDRFVMVADGIADNSFTIKNLVNGAEYNFVVYAVNADGERSASPIAASVPRSDADMAAPTPPKEGESSTNDSPLENVSIPAQSPQSLTAIPGDGATRLSWQPPAEGQSGFDTMRGHVDKWLSEHKTLGPITLPRNLDAVTEQYADQASQVLKLSASRLTTYIASSLGNIVTAILIPIIAVFILADIDRLRARMYLFLPERSRRFAQTTILEIGEVFGNYLRGLLIICSMYGGACMAYLFVVSIWFPGLRGYALLLGVLAGILYSVPYIGAIATVALTAVAALTSGAGIGGALFAAGGVLFLNQFFDYVVMPKVVGELSGINPLLAMFALFLGGHLLGLWGMLLAVPVAASIQGVLFRLYPQLSAPTPISLMMHERKHGEPDKTEPGAANTDAAKKR